MSKRRVYWPFGNPVFDAWQVDTPAGTIVVRRNHQPSTGRGPCQGWEVWLDGRYLGAIGALTLAEVSTQTAERLEQMARTACCSHHAEYPTAPVRKSGRGGARLGSGRKPKGEDRRVDLSTSVARRTLTLIDELRGASSRGEYLDRLVQSQAGQ